MQIGLTPHQIVYSLVGLGDPQISPDGSRVVFVHSTAEDNLLRPESHLYLWDEADYRTRQLTTASATNGCPRWSPNGEEIAFTSFRNGEHGIYTINPNRGEAVRQTSHPSPCGELAWAPHGIVIAYTAAFDPENPTGAPLGKEDAPPVRVVNRIDYKQENRGFLNNVRNALWTVEIFTEEKYRLTDDQTDHLAPAWSPDCRMIATRITRTNGMTSQLCITDTYRRHEPVVVGPEDGFVSTWAWTPDSSAILYSGDTTQSWQADWFIYTLATGETRRITTDLPVAVDGGFPTVALPSQPVWLDEDNVLYHASLRGQSGLYRLTVSTGAHHEITNWSAMHGGFSVDEERRHVVQVASDPRSFSRLVMTDLTTLEVGQLDNPNLEYILDDYEGLDNTIGRWERITINRAGLDLDAWLLLPPLFHEENRYPLVLDIHGGPNAHHGPGFNAVQQALAGAGFPVLFTNPRGSTSYGRAFTQAVIGDWGGEDYADQMAFVDELCKRPYIDGERLGVYGYSYGGFMTSWIIGHTNRFKAAVIGAPVVDLASFYGTSDIGHMFGPLQIGGSPWENPEEYRKHSPITYLHTATTPALVLHGEADDRVPIGQGEQCFMTLKQAGCVTEFVRYPGEAHAMLRTGLPAHKYDYLTRVIGWFEKYLNNLAPS